MVRKDYFHLERVNEKGVMFPFLPASPLGRLWIGPSAILWLNVDTVPWAEICQKVVRENLG